MKTFRQAFPVVLAACLLALALGGVADATLPSGNGRTTMAKSVSVVIASDQAAVPVSGTITATVDTSALATSALQTSGAQKAQRVDGSGNVAPAGDTVGRSGFSRITDGTTTAAVDVSTTALKVLEQNQPVYEDNSAGVAIVEHRYSNAIMTTATTTTIKSGSGVLHAVCANTCVAAATIKVYDALTATGTPRTITCGATAVALPCQMYDTTFATGLTVVTSGATDVSLSYR